ncbi:N-acetyltransferase family protein [Enterobacteriaceae bacterium H20N1]|uniref:N-acetyltransferase family protein n=1 Tax=Dryocola boscaweniae TaxID=2925397 RepID=A0A9X3AMZ9_9ENTR|nr:GNAT family N-acetyltransferase [Dryocola boscaweniae]MCT4701286.1 N-acetyltransferase family protein [Dryocola boscaweniae]MCT4716027.1 N-acetyltransferase family protein [Dryocola boscaweniae]MCT4718478.1 N-acetyltransferase family protein [Dryocola boscaweniae]
MSVVETLPFARLDVREATLDDIPAITAIYAWHILHGRGSFEEKPPTELQMRERLQCVREQGLPWLTGRYGGIVVGYCYATVYRPRPAYRFTIEDSVYIDASMTGRGIGSELLSALITRCEEGPWRQMIAVIGDGEKNTGSCRLHKRLGFEIVGNLRSVGFKLGDWRDTLIMQRPLNDGDWTLPD